MNLNDFSKWLQYNKDYIYILQWCEKCWPLPDFFFFFCMLPHVNVADQQTN